MSKPNEEIRVILIGGSSHVGKSTLARSLAERLNWDYQSTDKLARHPGFPWRAEDGKERPADVIEHYRTLEVDALMEDVLAHYRKNVVPQVEAIVESRNADFSQKGIAVEGSALWPQFVAHLVREGKVKAIWVTASDELFRKRIYRTSRFPTLEADEQYLTQKFLERTLAYNRLMRVEAQKLGFNVIDVESVSTSDELVRKSLEMMKFPAVG